MKKYDIPEIEIKSFHCENVLTSSGQNQNYIPEIEDLQQNNIFGDTPAQFQKRMESFNALIEFSS